MYEWFHHLLLHFFVTSSLKVQLNMNSIDKKAQRCIQSKTVSFLWHKLKVNMLSGSKRDTFYCNSMQTLHLYWSFMNFTRPTFLQTNRPILICSISFERLFGIFFVNDTLPSQVTQNWSVVTVGRPIISQIVFQLDKNIIFIIYFTLKFKTIKKYY